MDASFEPCGVVSLTTDFGTADGYVGVMKGVLHARCPDLRAVIDVTHEVAPQDVRAAAFHLSGAWHWFPQGSVHVVVVDPGVGTDRRILVGQREGHLFLAPDNGVLGAVLDPDEEVRVLDLERFSLPTRSRTFHGRDVFAPAAAAFAGGVPVREAGPLARDWERLTLPQPEGRRGEVLVVDRFGNLITNLPAVLIEEGGGWSVRVGEREVPLRPTYGDAAPGELLALVDSYDRIEVALRNGSAAAALGLGPGAPVELVKTP